MTIYSEFKHPNMMTGVSEQLVEGQNGAMPMEDDDADRGCGYYFSMFDDTILRPILIYKYKLTKYSPEVKFDQVLQEIDNRNTERSENKYKAF
jgi:hypothetical protein